MSLVVFITAVVVGLMLAETRVSVQHERALRAAGAVLPPGDVYRALAILYPLAFLLMGVEGGWRALTGAGRDPGSAAGPDWMASGVLLFAASKAVKYWAIRSLGTRWTFRVLVLPGVPLVIDGPYRYVTHPNYIAVVGELVGTAMMVGASVLGPVMTAAFGAALVLRVRFENQILRSIDAAAASPHGPASQPR